MSWHHHHLLCGRPETLPANNIGDRCATVDKVLRSLAMQTSVHDDTKLVRYWICHIEPVERLYSPAYRYRYAGTDSSLV